MIDSKKGALFHWIVFGILAALGLFFLLVQSTDVGLKVKGEWHTAFLKNYFVEGEKELLNVEQSALVIGGDVALTLAAQGGFLEESECGIKEDVHYWNSEDNFCFPDINNNVDVLFNRKWKEHNQEGAYVVTFAGEELVGKSNYSVEISHRSTLKEKALAKLKEEERGCLLQLGKVPLFELSGTSCESCPGSGCEKYVNRFYCDLDPCSLNCVSFYEEEQYTRCGECPEEKSCDKYINQYYCELDPCNYGCVWDVNSCKEGIIKEKSWEKDREEKITLITFPESFNKFTKYIYYPHFRVDLGYSFEEYDQLKKEAVGLLSQCRNEKNLQDCLVKSKPKYWKFTSCTSENFVENNRKVAFCVESPKGAQLFGSQGDLKAVQYKLGLDFTPGEALAIKETEIKVESKADKIEISFPLDSTADKYKVYYTDYLQLEGQTGSAAEIFAQVPTSLGYSVIDWVILPSELVSSCSFAETGTAYLCDEKVVYVLSRDSFSSISEGGYLFTVTTMKENQESEVKSLIKVNE